MKYTKNALNILTAKTYKGIGNGWIAKNLTKVLSYEKIDYDVIVELLNKTLKKKTTEEEFLGIRKNIDAKLEKLEYSCDGITALGDEDFPKFRGKVKDGDKPSVLFYKGDLSLLDLNNYNVAVIGLLNPDENIEKKERKIVDLLAKSNAIIVSGLALGCDRIAHHQALKSKTTTVAILPSPINNIIPKDCIPLGEYIGNNGGLLISEYYDEPKTRHELIQRYIDRDRLQALFSDMVLLAASYSPTSKEPVSDNNKQEPNSDKNKIKLDSGSRHAMKKAGEYGIKRAVIYNEENKNNPKYDLNRELIKEDKNIIVVDPNLSYEKILNIINKNSVKKEQQKDLF